MKNQSKGFTLVELLVVIGILGILMSALFPAITGAMRNANMSACSMNGVKLWTQITAANTSRAAVGESDIWPSNGSGGGSEDSEADDITKSFNNSADYFTELFDLANAGQGADKYNPYVEVDMKVLWGFGVNGPKANANKLQAQNVLWSIAANMPDNAPDFIPLLVSRNVNCAQLLGKRTGSSSETIGLGASGGSSYDTPFASKGCVFITRGGAGTKIDNARLATTRTVYSQQFDLTANSSDSGAFCYLTPDSKVTPK